MQADEMRVRISDNDWVTQRDSEELRAEHLLEQAPGDRGVGWKAWIAKNGSGAGNGGAGDAAVAVPAAGVTLRMRD